MERSVFDGNLDVDHLEAGVDTGLDGLCDAVHHRRDVLLGDGTTNDLVDDLDALALFVRLDIDDGVTVLAATTGLADELALALGRLGDGFAVGDLRSAGVGLDGEFALQTVADDLKMQLAHAGDDQLSGFFVGEATECRIFFSQTLEALGHLVLVGLRLRLDGHADDRFREGRGFEGDVEVLVAQGVTCGDVAQTDEGRDVAGVDGVHVLALAALNDHQSAHTLALAGAGIVDRIALLELAGIDTEEHQLAGVRVGPKLERERAELAVVVRGDFQGVFGTGNHALSRRNIQRRGQVIDDGIDQNLDTLLLESGATQDRDELDLASEAADGGLEDGNRDGLLFENQLGNCVVLVGDGIDELGQCGGGALLMSSRNIGDLVL